MFAIHTENDLSQLRHLQSKKNIIVRFVMNGCGWCEQSQPMWDDATKRAVLSSDDAIAEIESSFVNHFKQTMTNRDKINIRGYPTILIIRGKRISEHKGRDSESILSALRQIKKLRSQPKSSNFKSKTKTKKTKSRSNFKSFT